MTTDTKFRPGDRVRVRAVATLARADHGRTGVVDTVYPGTPYPYGVVHDDNGEAPVYSADELERVSDQPAPAGSTPSTMPVPGAGDRERRHPTALAAQSGIVAAPGLEHAQPGDRVRIVAGWHAGRHGTVELGRDDPTSRGDVRVRIDGATHSLPYAPGELEPVVGLRQIAYVPDASPRPDDVVSAEEFNAAYPVGTPVLAFPGSKEGRALHTKTRTPAWTMGGHTAVVTVENYAGGIALMHVEVIR